MPNRLKLPFALMLVSLLLNGCMPQPEDIPPLAMATTAAVTSS